MSAPNDNVLIVPSRNVLLTGSVIRRNDYGFNVGGPVWIPKLYNGKNRTFFFFNREQYREFFVVNNVPITVPTAAYRA
jgi:hypothetical protein